MTISPPQAEAAQVDTSPRAGRRRSRRVFGVPPALLTMMAILSLATSANGEAKPEPFDFTQVEEVLRAAVEEGAFPGCVASIGTSAGTIWLEPFGHLDVARSSPTTPKTMYDLASLTKVVGTTSVVLCLVRDGKMRLEDPLAKHLPEFVERAPSAEDRERRAAVRIEHLLTHCAGLIAWRPYWRDVDSYTELLDDILETPLARAPGARTGYSDLGFILLGEAASRAGGATLSDLERRLVLDPLRLADTQRNPEETLRGRIAPTERVVEPAPGEREGGREPEPAPPSERYHHGVVHDENARAAGGGTGHAGLFSTAGDLSRLAMELLRGLRGESELFPRKLLERFTRRADLVEGSSRALGWDTPSAGSSAGELLSAAAFGHTGFTGTSLWVDPERDLFLLLLSNRVHPTRANRKIGEVRRRFADAAVRAYDAVRGDAPAGATPESRGEKGPSGL